MVFIRVYLWLGFFRTRPILQNRALRTVDLGSRNQRSEERNTEGEKRLSDGFDAKEQAAGKTVVLGEKYGRAMHLVGCQDGLGRFGVRRSRRIERGYLGKRGSLSRDAADLVAEFGVRPGVAVAFIQ